MKILEHDSFKLFLGNCCALQKLILCSSCITKRKLAGMLLFPSNSIADISTLLSQCKRLFLSPSEEVRSLFIHEDHQHALLKKQERTVNSIPKTMLLKTARIPFPSTVVERPWQRISNCSPLYWCNPNEVSAITVQWCKTCANERRSSPQLSAQEIQFYNWRAASSARYPLTPKSQDISRLLLKKP